MTLELFNDAFEIQIKRYWIYLHLGGINGWGMFVSPRDCIIGSRRFW